MTRLSWSLIFLVCTLLCLPLKSQVNLEMHVDSVLVQKIQAEYPFIDLKKNQLEIAELTGWMPFFQKLERMRKGFPEQMHIIHIGGSHVQAGFLSNQIEKKLKTLFPNDWLSEKGFVFPYQLGNTNAPEGYRLRYNGTWQGCRSSVRSMQCNWGFSGINATATTAFSRVWIQPEDHQKQQQPFCTVRIFCDVEGSSLIPEPYTENCPAHIEIDSLSGTITWYFDEVQNHLEFLLIPIENQDSGQFVLQGFQFLSDDPGVVMHPIGVNGASLQSYLQCQGFGYQLQSIQPDLVLFAIGVNDANVPRNEFSPEKFEMQYDSLITHFKAANPEVRLLFITNNDTYYKRKYANKNAIQVKEVMYRLARKHGGAVWNLFDIMGGLGSIQKWHLKGLAKKDKIHFTAAGYTLVGNLFVEALKNSWIQTTKIQNDSP
jgi:lysophospholipase L1-like esterase